MTALLSPVELPALPTSPVPGRRNPWPDLRWAVVTAVLGPVADRNPDVAMALLGAADELVAAGRARWWRGTPTGPVGGWP